MKTRDSIVLTLASGLVKWKLYIFTVVAYNCIDNPLTIGSVLSEWDTCHTSWFVCIEVCLVILFMVAITQIHAYSFIIHNTRMLITLGTHLAQNISVFSPSPGEISVTGDFIDLSMTNGILVLAYSSRSLNVTYYLYSNSHNDSHFNIILHNLEGGDYRVSVFTAENGLPYREAASKPLRVYVPSVESECQTNVQ